MSIIYSRFTFGRTTCLKCFNPCVRVCPNPQNQNTPLALEEKHSPSLHKRMASRFFPKSLKLSSNSAPGNDTIRHIRINSCTCLPARAVATSSVSSYSTKNCMQSAKKRTGLVTVALYLAFSRTIGRPGDSPSLPWSLAASTQLLQGCPSIISGLGNDLRSATVAIAVEPSPRWICCCCFSCCLAARRSSPLTSSSALSDILSATM